MSPKNFNIFHVGQAASCLIGLSLALSACQGLLTISPTATSPQAEPTGSPTPQVTSTSPTTETPPPASPTPQVTPSPTAPPEVTRTRYDLSVDFDYSRHTLSVTETITYTNNLETPLAEILLLVPANFQGGVFSLNNLAWSDGGPVEGYSLEQTALTIPLPAPLDPGDSLQVSLNFDLRLPAISGSLGYTDYQANLVNWYPFVPPYREGSGWIVNKPWPIGEYLAYDPADFNVRIRLSGAIEPILAAGAVEEHDGEWSVFELRDARSFAWSASPYYQISSRQVGDIAVSAFTFAGHEAAAQAALQASTQALELYGELFGPYTRPVLHLVEASFPDGMEFDGLIFISQGYLAEYDGTSQNFLTILSAHETAHQWWFSLVGNDQAQEPWLDEALATYSELLFYERFYPELVEWWWFFRVNYFNPQGWINQSIYDYGRFEPYFQAVYHRGALFHRDLRATMGDEAYFGFLGEYARRFGMQIVTADDFLALLREFSPVDLQPVLDEYFKTS